MSKKIWLYSFIFIELTIYCSFIYLDVQNGGSRFSSNLLKYIGIILCNLFLLFYRQSVGYTQPFIAIHLSLMLVLICDYFLLFTSDFVWGLLVFCIIQFIYFFHIKGKYELFKYSSVILFMTSLITFIAQENGMTTQFLEIVAVFYFLCLISNIIISLCQAKKAPGNIREQFFTISLILFLLCDLNVGVVNLIQYIPDSLVFKWHLYEFSAILMWVFYLPAQVMMTVSALFYQRSSINC